MKKSKNIFFGTPQISVFFLERLKKEGFSFDFIVTNPDKPQGRKKILTPSPVKIWAEKNKIDFLQPEKIDQDFIKKIKKENWDFFFVFAWAKILPKEVLEIPKLGVLNLHPSLLPKYRGPSPIISAILEDQKETGISIMKINEKMDAGPIFFSEKISIKEWEKNSVMEKFFAEKGAENFLKILSDFLDEKISPQKQNEEEATYCKKFFKEDMELFFPFTKENARKNFLKYCAFSKPFYFDENGKRNIVSDAVWENENFKILKIIPEGKKEKNFI